MLNPPQNQNAPKIDLNRDENGKIKLLYSASELVSMVPISRTEIYKQVSEGKLGCVRFGKKYFFRPKDIKDWIENNEL